MATHEIGYRARGHIHSVEKALQGLLQLKRDLAIYETIRHFP